MNALEILEMAVEKEASDVFLIPGTSCSLKINGQLNVSKDGQVLLPDDLMAIIEQIYGLAGNRSMDKVKAEGDDDFSFSVRGLSRFRASVFKQRGSMAAVIRVVRFELPDNKELDIPETVMDLAKMQKGLVLVTGSAGSGKSTTLACIIDAINKTRHAHVITLEDPIEFLHKHNKSIVTQREISTDTEDYASALRGVLRQAPDVILLGELRDYETIRTAMTAAETGHLVFSTLHTVGAANTIDRIIDVFPENQQGQIRQQLSMVLKAVVSQQLIPDEHAGEVGHDRPHGATPAFEVMLVNDAIRNMIRENKVHQIDSVIAASRSEGMINMDVALMEQYKAGKISREAALDYSVNRELMEKRLERG